MAAKRVYYLTGPNGAGKSTLLESLEGPGITVIQESLHTMPQWVIDAGRAGTDPEIQKQAQRWCLREEIEKNELAKAADTPVVVMDGNLLGVLFFSGIFGNDVLQDTLTQAHETTDWLAGEIIVVEAPMSTLKERYMHREHLSEDQWNDWLPLMEGLEQYYHALEKYPLVGIHTIQNDQETLSPAMADFHHIIERTEYHPLDINQFAGNGEGNRLFQGIEH